MNIETLQQKASKIKAFVFDVDGALTDGGVYYDNNGIEGKRFDIKDGWAMVQIHKMGYKTAIITGKISHVVEVRAKELKVDFVRQKISEKLPVLIEFAEQYELKMEEIAYIGDDLIDLPALLRCGLSACPADASHEVIERVDYVCDKNGGHGAARELIEYVLKIQGRWSKLVEQYVY